MVILQKEQEFELQRIKLRQHPLASGGSDVLFSRLEDAQAAQARAREASIRAQEQMEQRSKAEMSMRDESASRARQQLSSAEDGSDAVAQALAALEAENAELRRRLATDATTARHSRTAEVRVELEAQRLRAELEEQANQSENEMSTAEGQLGSAHETITELERELALVTARQSELKRTASSTMTAAKQTLRKSRDQCLEEESKRRQLEVVLEATHEKLAAAEAEAVSATVSDLIACVLACRRSVSLSPLLSSWSSSLVWGV